MQLTQTKNVKSLNTNEAESPDLQKTIDQALQKRKRGYTATHMLSKSEMASNNDTQSLSQDDDGLNQIEHLDSKRRKTGNNFSDFKSTKIGGNRNRSLAGSKDVTEIEPSGLSVDEDDLDSEEKKQKR